MYSLQWVMGLSQGLLPVGCAQKTSKWRRPRGILISFPNFLSWFLLTWSSSGSTLSSLGMFKLLTLTLKLSPCSHTKKETHYSHFGWSKAHGHWWCLPPINTATSKIRRKWSPLAFSVISVCHNCNQVLCYKLCRHLRLQAFSPNASKKSVSMWGQHRLGLLQ